MVTIKAKSGESIDELLKRFKKAVDHSGILSDFRKKERYEKPSVKRKRKQAAARKRVLRKDQKKEDRFNQRTKGPNWRWNKNHTKKIPMKTYTGPRDTNTSSRNTGSRNTSAGSRGTNPRYNNNPRKNTRSNYRNTPKK